MCSNLYGYEVYIKGGYIYAWIDAYTAVYIRS